MRKTLKKMLIAILALIIIIAFAIYAFVQTTPFGRNPSGERLEQIKKSPNYKDGQFQNLEHTPALNEDYNYFTAFYEALFKKSKKLAPIDSIPAIKTDLKSIPLAEDILVWFGHSSYYLQIDGKRILVDPVFCGNVSPLPGSFKSFKGSDRYTVEDIPDLNLLILTHDHWDHLDFETVKILEKRTQKILCPLGVGQHLEFWNFKMSKVSEKDWFEDFYLNENFKLTTAPARHFSGRGFNRNKALWTSYVLKSPNYNLYLGGDSGYGKHFKTIGEKYGPFDLAILENGQYDIKWKYIHMMPEEVLKATKDLKAKRVFPVHSSKFALANHAWNDPLTSITEANKKYQIPLVTPIIGELVNLKNNNQEFSQWWKSIN